MSAHTTPPVPGSAAQVDEPTIIEAIHDGMAPGAKPETNLFSASFVERFFGSLRENAVQDLTRYVSGWSIYSVHFLNAVAMMQGVSARLDNETILLLRRGAKRAKAPELLPLLEAATGPHDMEIERIIGVIRAEVGQE